MTTDVASFNCGNAKADRTPDDLSRIKAHIYGLQETFDRKKQIAAWCKENGFRDVPFEKGWGDTPILYDPRKVKLVNFDAYPVTEHDTNVGPKGAGPTVIHVKYVTHARFRDLETHRLLNVLNTHVVASWTRNDLGAQEERLRRELGDKHIALLVRRVNLLRAATACTGDFNAEKDFAGMRPLAKVVDLGHTGPTAKKRTIDFVGTKGETLIKVQREVIMGTSSDHRPVKARLTLRPAA